MNRFGVKYIVGVVSFAVVGVLLTPEQTFACACCAEPYEYRESSGLMPYEMAELAGLQLIGSWEARYGQGDPQFEFRKCDVRLEIISSGWKLLDSAWHTQSDVPDTLTPAGTFSWRMDVLDSGRIIDSILFVYDSSFQSWADMRYILSPSAYSQIIGDDAETVLYKEIRLFGTLEPLGEYLRNRAFDFSGPVELRFCGRGNHCFSGGEFDEWSLAFRVRKGMPVEHILAHGTMVIKH